MSDKITRREFLQKVGLVSAGLALGADGLLESAEAAAVKPFCIAKGGGPASLTKQAIAGIGGMKKFVKRGNTVVIKPNFAWARTPEQAANTHPDIVSTLIKLCKEAGAKRVVVIEHTCDSASVAFSQNGARAACASAGARLIAADSESMYRQIHIPNGKVIKSDTCLKEILDADVFINVPKAKVHGSSTITASMKNLMGANWDRGRWHSASNFEQCIADYSSAVKPDLVVLDATRILLTNGPKGPGQTKDVGQVVASTDPVAIDAYAAYLLGKNPQEVNHIKYAAAMHLGQIDWKKLKVKKV